MERRRQDQVIRDWALEACPDDSTYRALMRAIEKLVVDPIGDVVVSSVFRAGMSADSNTEKVILPAIRLEDLT